jgi:hypothetical protein
MCPGTQALPRESTVIGPSPADVVRRVHAVRSAPACAPCCVIPDATVRTDRKAPVGIKLAGIQLALCDVPIKPNSAEAAQSRFGGPHRSVWRRAEGARLSVRLESNLLDWFGAPIAAQATTVGFRKLSIPMSVNCKSEVSVAGWDRYSRRDGGRRASGSARTRGTEVLATAIGSAAGGEDHADSGEDQEPPARHLRQFS